MNEMTTVRWSLLDDVSFYSEAGIEAIGVWRPKLAEFGEERGVELLRDSALSVSTVAWAGGFTGMNGHSFREAVDDARDAISVAADVEAACLMIASGSRCGHTKKHARRLLVQGLRELADTAASYEIALAVAPMHRMFADEWTFLTTIDQTLDVLDEVDHPSIRMAFDVYQLWQEPRLIERIPDLVPRLATVQLSDWKDPPRSENDRCMLGEGQIPLDAIIAALVEHGYSGYFDIQIWSDDLWRSDYTELLRRCCAQFDSLCPAAGAPG